MLRDLLWLASAKQQYDIQRSSGLAGLMGIVSVIFIALKWEDWFYPLLEKMGLVSMAHRVGIVSGNAALTTLYVILILAILCFMVALIAFLVVWGIGVFFAIGNTKVGLNIISIAIIIVFAPIIFPIVFYARQKDKKQKKVDSENGIIHPTTLLRRYNADKSLKRILNKYKDEFESIRMFHLFQEQTKRNGDILEQWYEGKEQNINLCLEQRKKINTFLNRAVASVSDDNKWLIGYFNNNSYRPKDEDHVFYLLFPNPLPDFVSENFLDDRYEEGSIIQLDYKHINRGHSLYNFGITNFLYGEKVYKNAPLFVPAIEIEFVWNGFEVVPQVKENATIKSISTEHLDIFHVKSDIVNEFYNNVGQRTDVQTAIREAHIALYLIPVAYDNTELDLFNEYVQAIPNALAFSPIYSADVQERIVQYAEVGKEWAIQWLAKDI